jgi:peptidoglycan/xylan/chitin deacetylase (PgdA/CDA1 family)
VSPPSAAYESSLDTTAGVSWKRGALRVVQGAMHRSGLGLAYRAVARPRGATVLMYHSVPGADASPFVDPANAMSPALFERQMRMLARRRRVVSMTALVETLARGETPPAGTVVLTFDDGYLDNLEVVAPILSGLGLPAVLYLATGYVAREEPQWIDELYRSFRWRTRDELRLEGAAHALRDAGPRLAAYRTTARGLVTASPDERARRLRAVREQLAPSRSGPRLTLGWADVRRLAEAHPSFELGIHTDEHVDLTAMSLEAAEAEIRASLARFERETGRVARHFSFPYNRRNAELGRLVRSLGLSSAVASGAEALITARSDPFALPRIEAPRSLALLGFYTSGAYPGLSRALLGRA